MPVFEDSQFLSAAVTAISYRAQGLKMEVYG